MLRDSGCMLRVVIVVLSLVLRVTGCGLLGTVVFVLSSLTSHRFVTGCMFSSLSGCICCLISCVTGCGFRVTSCGLQVIVVVRLYLLSSLSYFLLLIAHRSPLTSHLFCCGLRVSSYRLPLLSCCLTFYFSLLIAHFSLLTSHLSLLIALLRVAGFKLQVAVVVLLSYFLPLTSHLSPLIPHLSPLLLRARNLPYIHHSKFIIQNYPFTCLSA